MNSTRVHGEIPRAWLTLQTSADEVSSETPQVHHASRRCSGGVAARGARVQHAKLPTIGFLGSGTPATHGQWAAAFVQRLRELGWVEGRTVAIEYRWANGDRQRMRTLAEELIGLHVAVLVATGGAHLAAKAATASVPIVCGLGADPIKFGLAESIKRPLATISTPNCLFDGALKRGLWRLLDGRVSPCVGRRAIFKNISADGRVRYLCVS